MGDSGPDQCERSADLIRIRVLECARRRVVNDEHGAGHLCSLGRGRCQRTEKLLRIIARLLASRYAPSNSGSDSIASGKLALGRFASLVAVFPSRF
jgi:hypothetical protein